jgi:protocatechuate 3,4-dioxygenase beta subunit
MDSGQVLTKLSRSRFAVFAVALLAISLLLGALPASAAPSGTGSISGRVLDQNGAPVADICVAVENGQNAVSDPSGAYAITGLDAGEYKVDFTDCRPTPEYVSQWYTGQHDASSASVLKVNEAMDTPIGDVNLAPGVAVSGTVTDTNGAPIAGANVAITALDSSKAAGTKLQTDGAGQYRSEPLAPADYKVQFSDSNGVLATEYWNNAPSWNTADTLTVALSDGPVHGGVDAQLSAGATVEGKITDPNGDPLGNICADAQVLNNGGWDWVGGGVSDPSGAYTIHNVPPVDVRIDFRDCGNNLYLDQWYSGQTNAQDSTPLGLGAGETRSNIDAQMERGILVSGKVTDSDGNPISGIGVSVNSTGNGGSTSTQTDSDGNYTTGALRPGDYRVQFNDWTSDPVWAAQYWDGQLTNNAASTLTLTPADAPARTGINATMTKAASISGTVTAPDGEPAPGICVNAIVDDGNGNQDSVRGTGTAEDGTYTLNALPATTVKVLFQSCKDSGNYITQWWDDASNSDDAKAVTLESGAAVTGVDAKLAAAGVITGRITDSDGNPLENICAQATTSTFVGSMDRSDSDGRYTINLSRAGAYKVQFIDCNDTTKYAGEWWKDQPSAATAQVVNVGPGQKVGKVNAALSPGGPGAISGKVVNVNGAAMTSVCVIAYAPNQLVREAMVSDDGTYTIKGVPSGTYSLAFLGCGDKGDPSAVVQDPQSKATSYPGVWWAGAPISLKAQTSPDPIEQGATLVAVKPGDALKGFDWCFGCTAITITSVTPGAPGGGTLTVAFTSQLIHAQDRAKVAAAAADPAPPFEYTVTCTSPTGVTGSAKGLTSPITVSGLTPGATYSCTVTASDGTITVGSSAGSSDVQAASVDGGGATPAGTKAVTFPTTLPNTGTVGASMARTGSDSAAMARIGAALLAFGLALVLMTRSKRRSGRRRQASVV